MLSWLVTVASALQTPSSSAAAASSSRAAAPRTSYQQHVTFINPLEVDGFAEPGGWGTHADPSKLPVLVFLPGMDGSLATPFMQYAEVCRVSLPSAPLSSCLCSTLCPQRLSLYSPFGKHRTHTLHSHSVCLRVSIRSAAEHHIRARMLAIRRGPRLAGEFR